MSGVFNVSRLAGKTVMVTGSSGGIGAAAAILFARAGANLILTARRQPQLDEVAKLAKQANKEGGTGKGGQVATLTLDMQDRNAIEGIWERIPQSLRKIDVLVNNAGMVLGKEKVGEIKGDDVETMFNTNVLGLITLTQLLLNRKRLVSSNIFDEKDSVFNLIVDMKKENAGHIINIGSIAGREAYAGGSIYCATKHAVHAFTGSLLRELIDTPIRVSNIQPGMVETEFSVTRFRGDRSAADKVYQDVKPLVADDIAEEIVWAASRPDHVNIAEVLVFPKAQAGAGLVHRGELWPQK